MQGSRGIGDGATFELRNIWDGYAPAGPCCELASKEVRHLLARIGFDSAEVKDCMCELGTGPVAWLDFATWFEATGDMSIAEQPRKVFYRAHDGLQQFTTVDKLPMLMADSIINGETIVWAPGMKSWTALQEVRSKRDTALGRELRAELRCSSSDIVISVLRKVWCEVDSNAHGILNRDSVRSILRQMGHELATVEMDQAMLELGWGHDGRLVSWDSFEPWFLARYSAIAGKLRVYYAQDDVERHAEGEALCELVAKRIIKRETLIWVEGLKNWMPLGAALSTVGALRTAIGDALHTAESAYISASSLANMIAGPPSTDLIGIRSVACQIDMAAEREISKVASHEEITALKATVRQLQEQLDAKQSELEQLLQQSGQPQRASHRPEGVSALDSTDPTRAKATGFTSVAGLEQLNSVDAKISNAKMYQSSTDSIVQEDMRRELSMPQHSNQDKAELLLAAFSKEMAVLRQRTTALVSRRTAYRKTAI